MAYLLIIDDDEDFASATATVLKNAGHEVSFKLDPQSGLESMEKRCPDLAILDVMFPEDGSAGFQLARTIRKNSEKFNDIPLLMLTAINTKFPMGFSPNDIDDAWLPVTAFLEKPVDLDVLQAKVASLLQKANKA